MNACSVSMCWNVMKLRAEPFGFGSFLLRFLRWARSWLGWMRLVCAVKVYYSCIIYVDCNSYSSDIVLISFFGIIMV